MGEAPDAQAVKRARHDAAVVGHELRQVDLAVRTQQPAIRAADRLGRLTVMRSQVDHGDLVAMEVRERGCLAFHALERRASVRKLRCIPVIAAGQREALRRIGNAARGIPGSTRGKAWRRSRRLDGASFKVSRGRVSVR